jgi:predicted Zn-dependent protease
MKRLVLLGLVGVFVTACATSPEGRKQLMLLPESQMDAMGVQAFTDMKQKDPIDTNASDNAFVKCVANAITDALPQKQAWEVVVFQNDQVNAFALPGGKIGVLSGLLKVTANADQLGAVLGHEVGHVLAKHGAERASAQLLEQGGASVLGSILAAPGTTKYQLLMAGMGLGTQYGIAMPHSRTQETEADRIGLELMAKAGFDPLQAVELWKNMDRAGGAAPPEWLSDHPSNANRIADLQSRMPAAQKIASGVPHKTSCRR